MIPKENVENAVPVANLYAVAVARSLIWQDQMLMPIFILLAFPTAMPLVNVKLFVCKQTFSTLMTLVLDYTG